MIELVYIVVYIIIVLGNLNFINDDEVKFLIELLSDYLTLYNVEILIFFSKWMFYKFIFEVKTSRKYIITIMPIICMHPSKYI